jgi:hypothetical protein
LIQYEKTEPMLRLSEIASAYCDALVGVELGVVAVALRAADWVGAVVTFGLVVDAVGRPRVVVGVRFKVEGAGFSAVVEFGVVVAALAEMIEAVEVEAVAITVGFDALIPAGTGLMIPSCILLVAIMLVQ